MHTPEHGEYQKPTSELLFEESLTNLKRSRRELRNAQEGVDSAKQGLLRTVEDLMVGQDVSMSGQVSYVWKRTRSTAFGPGHDWVLQNTLPFTLPPTTVRVHEAQLNPVDPEGHVMGVYIQVGPDPDTDDVRYGLNVEHIKWEAVLEDPNPAA